MQRGLTWLNRAAEKRCPANAQAYAWYVLAKAGLAEPGRVRYFQDTTQKVSAVAWPERSSPPR